MEEKELVPRTYQKELIKIAVEKNSIIFLPTGSGKTFIAVCVLKEFAKNDFEKSYSEGGKISVVLANTVALVNQHTKYFQANTPYKIGSYNGKMNVDFWSKEVWLQEYNKHNVLIMTAQILLNNIQSNLIDISRVNLLVFDECHRAVDDHAMRQIMLLFQNINVQPRVLGLTATLLNGNVKTHKILEEIRNLEITFHAKVATIDGIEYISGFSTNPHENVMKFESSEMTPLQTMAVKELQELELMIRKMKPAPTTMSSKKLNLPYLEHGNGFKAYACICLDAAYHIQMLGIGGAYIAMICYLVHLNCDKCACVEPGVLKVLDLLITLFMKLKREFQKEMIDTPPKARLLKYSSKKVLRLVQLLQEHKQTATDEFCGIIFVKRRNTAVFLYHILKDMLKPFQNFDDIKPDFMIGFTANPLKTTKEPLYLTKMNKKVVDRFNSKEVNVLIASNVIEEGMDVPSCSLVIKFDHPMDYREYVQSKGRARHGNSNYHIMVDEKEYDRFIVKYNEYKITQEGVNNYLIGQNDVRNAPSKTEIDRMYLEMKPYFVDGPGSAAITAVSAISLLMMYCQALPADSYTTYDPVFYLEERNINESQEFRVWIEMPIICPIKEPIMGDFVSNKKDAKRLASFNACVLLHKMKLLDDNLLPIRKENVLIATDYLFPHWPENNEQDAGLDKAWRVYDKQIPLALEFPIQDRCYLHIINLTPRFEDVEIDVAKKIFSELYTNDLSFGIVTACPLPDLCQFPLFVSTGEIRVDLLINQKRLSLQASEMKAIQEFHHLIFNDVVDIIKRFLVIGECRKNMFVVPVTKSNKSIDFNVINTYKSVKDYSEEPKQEERLLLDMNNLDKYKGSIVIPWYRMEDKQYVVLEVCEYLSADSRFPNEEFISYKDYFEQKYFNTNIVHPNQPLLKVKALSSRLNCLKPRGVSNRKRAREVEFEDTEMHLIPELCIKQDLPGCLWVQSKLLPSILHRISQFVRAEYLRHVIAWGTGLGKMNLPGTVTWKPLELDINLIHYEANIVEDENRVRKTEEELEEPIEMAVSDISNLELNREFVERIENSAYPWRPDQEPIDIIRKSLTCTLLDIKYYSGFINEQLYSNPLHNSATDLPTMAPTKLAINFDQTFEHMPIKLLDFQGNTKGPELADIYQVLATAKCNDIVNLERLETLGDSYLKLIASLFIFLRFPTLNEGESTILKGRLISNKNLFYLSRNKKLGSLVKISDFSPKAEWLPPGYCVPREIADLVTNKQLPITALFNVCPKREEQLSGKLSPETFEILEHLMCPVDEEIDKSSYSSFCNFLEKQVVRDKTMADIVEALIGVYFNSCGFHGALKLIEWLELIPKSENITELFKQAPKDPIVNLNATQDNLEILLPKYTQKAIEEIIGYTFKNKAYLLQAITHSSYTTNRVTLSYERLEFIGDAVLDFLITVFIYEHYGHLDPGKLTDLRSALVNNETFAAYVVKLNLHKYLKHFNPTLSRHIHKFVKYQESKGFAINDEVLILLNEKDLRIAENVDVPKVLGDLFESIAGAIYLDSGMDLNVVWRVYYKLMWKEISQFSNNIPKNPIRILTETLAPLHPNFHSTVDVGGGIVMVKLDFMLKGSLTRVHGFANNKKSAKKAASKIALRLLTSIN